MAYDLPAGARRLVQKADGYRHTIVGGVETVVDDEFTGELPGRLLRGHADRCPGAARVVSGQRPQPDPAIGSEIWRSSTETRPALLMIVMGCDSSISTAPTIAITDHQHS